MIGNAIIGTAIKSYASEHIPSGPFSTYEFGLGLAGNSSPALTLGGSIGVKRPDNTTLSGSYSIQGDSGNLEQVLSIKAGTTADKATLELQGSLHKVRICEPEFSLPESDGGGRYFTIGATASYPLTEKENVFLSFQKPIGESKGINENYNQSRILLGVRHFI